MPPFERHLFVCENQRPAGHPKGCCADKGSLQLRAAFKAAIGEAGLAGLVRANAAGCLDACEYGISVVVYPEGVWYGGVTLKDVPEIVQSHLKEGRPVERLRIHFPECEASRPRLSGNWPSSNPQTRSSESSSSGSGRSKPCASSRRTPFEALAHSVTHQQLGGAAAQAIFGRLKKTLGGRLSATRLVNARTELLRAAGLSGSKVLSLKDLAARTLDGTVPGRAEILRLSDDEIIERLTSIRGIGKWTVEMLLLKLGRPDILPATDLGIRRGFGAVFGKGGLAAPGEILSRGERWRPFRSTASFYLWKAS